jgi:hypothetical protein
MLEGLQRLLSQGYFSESKTQKETEILFQRASDPISAFQTEMGIYDKNLITTRADALIAYLSYCDAVGVQPDSVKSWKSDFTNGMQRLAPKVKDGWVVIAGKNVRAWKGFGLKTLESLNLEKIPQIPQQPHQSLLDDNLEDSLKNKEGIKGVVSVVSVVTPDPEKSALRDKLKVTYDFIKQKHRELGPFDIKLVEDEDALKILMRDGKVFEPQQGFIAPTEA